MQTSELTKFVQSNFKKLADPVKAKPMAQYMKTDMPFYGIQKPDRLPVYKEMAKRFIPHTHLEYKKAVLALWQLPYREEKYAALEYACKFKSFIDSQSLPLYEKLIREGAWWDFVDTLAIHLVGGSLLKEANIKPVMKKWVEDDDMWIRRSAILSQINHKNKTDEKMLFQFCLAQCHEKEFFIRKSIGWALRSYSYTAPKQVKGFLLNNKNKLSPLTFREGAKQLIRIGAMKAK
jgi:3-methyladenine DNA glycosylase AlkD